MQVVLLCLSLPLDSNKFQDGFRKLILYKLPIMLCSLESISSYFFYESAHYFLSNTILSMNSLAHRDIWNGKMFFPVDVLSSR